jgi:hypothetical protein
MQGLSNDITPGYVAAARRASVVPRADRPDLDEELRPRERLLHLEGRHRQRVG